MNKRTMNKRAKKKTKWEEIDDFVEEVYAKVDAEIKSRGGNLQEIETHMQERANELGREIVSRLDDKDGEYVNETARCYALFSLVANREGLSNAPKQAVFTVATHALTVSPGPTN